jgi:amino acid transporter
MRRSVAQWTCSHPFLAFVIEFSALTAIATLSNLVAYGLAIFAGLVSIASACLAFRDLRRENGDLYWIAACLLFAFAGGSLFVGWHAVLLMYCALGLFLVGFFLTNAYLGPQSEETL